MNPRAFTGAVVSVVLAGALVGSASLLARDTEEELLARLKNEHNPIKKAKYDIRLGRIKLEQAIAAYDQGNLDVGVQLLDAYLQRIKDAWQALRGSGRNAARHPQGFKELDIALRGDIRLLEDLRHRVSFYDREPIKRVSDEIEGIRSEVLRALFPAERSSSTGNQSVLPSGLSLVEAPREDVSTRMLKDGLGHVMPSPSLLLLSGALHRTAQGEGKDLSSSLSPRGANFAKDHTEQLPAKGQDILSDEEDEKIREAQDPSDRIQVYIEFAQARLDRVDEFRQKPADAQLDIGAFLGKMMDQYITLTDEMKNWIQDQYDRQGDMRRGLRKLLEAGPRQIEELRRIQESPGPYAADYRKSLGEAMDDLSDALDGAAKALQAQEKKFGELKKQEKADARTAKEREKEEKKRAKEEKKLRKRELKHRVPSEEDED
jgi:hypothetical protein